MTPIKIMYNPNDLLIMHRMADVKASVLTSINYHHRLIMHKGRGGARTNPH